VIVAAVLAFAPRIASAQVASSLAESVRAVVARTTFDPSQADQITTTPTATTIPLTPAPHQFAKFSPTMQSLYVMTAAVQGLDARTTFQALDLGATETNSIVKPFASNKPAFLAVKAGMAAAFIYEGHQMSKHHKIGAIIALSLVNSLYTAIAINNYKVIHTMQAQGR